MIKIAIIAPGSLPIPAVNGGAIETLVTGLIEQNEREGYFDFSVYTCWPDDIIAVPQYKYTRIIPVEYPKLQSFLYYLYARARRIVLLRKVIEKQFSAFICKKVLSRSREKYDYLLIEGNHYQTIQLQGLKIPLVLHLHTDLLNQSTPQGSSIVRSCSKVFVISEFLKKRVLEIKGIDSKKVMIFKNAIHTEVYGLNEFDDFRQEFRGANHIEDNEKLFIFCGRLDRGKGVKELLLAFRQITVKAKLLVVGGTWFDTNQNSEYTKELYEIAETLRDRVIFTGYVKHEELPKYYYVADVGIFPSICNEAAGLVIIEALASGLPVITTNMGGIPEYASNLSCTIVHNDNNLINNLSFAMESYVTDETLYKQKKEHAKISAKDYSMEQYYENFCNLFEVKYEKDSDHNIS